LPVPRPGDYDIPSIGRDSVSGFLPVRP
jgi:hypothetical protein